MSWTRNDLEPSRGAGIYLGASISPSRSTYPTFDPLWRVFFCPVGTIALKRSLELLITLCVVFIPENGGGAEVRFKKT